MLAERIFNEIGLKVIAHKDTDNGKAYRSIELLGLGIKANNPIVQQLIKHYSKSIAKAYLNPSEFSEALEEGGVRVLLIPDIQYGDATVLNKFESVCSFIEKVSVQ